ncbi:MAG TPA: BadF/BadG/BcrA/BcrD ATPase family protein [Fimbriimonadaceae bacterium]|nr:BadF/BadG/BcrA/BcrD ATPase family protein [Fimbriimonadaceae bacterium]HRJ33569.1 BadF/BadG/BcrA/BcrD ATPase family protein [Fimbriimonadaceae bacterium]
MSRVLGIDGGGTTTRAWAVEAGQVIWKGQSGPSNWSSTPGPRLRQNLAKALVGAPRVDSVCGCFAGLITHNQKAEAETTLRELAGCSRVAAFPDYRATWAACPAGTTALVIAGTGSVIVSEPRPGELRRDGGGGPLFGDFGSSFGLVRSMLQRCVEDGQPLPRKMAQKAAETYGTDQLDAVISWLHQAPSPAAAAAKLAKPLVQAAQLGDRWAEETIQAEMLKLARVLIRHLEDGHEPQGFWSIVLAGGAWKLGETILRTFEDSCERLLSGRRGKEEWGLQTLQMAPVWGAVLLAEQQLK